MPLSSKLAVCLLIHGQCEIITLLIGIVQRSILVYLYYIMPINISRKVLICMYSVVINGENHDHSTCIWRGEHMHDICTYTFNFEGQNENFY